MMRSVNVGSEFVRSSVSKGRSRVLLLFLYHWHDVSNTITLISLLVDTVETVQNDARLHGSIDRR